MKFIPSKEIVKIIKRIVNFHSFFWENVFFYKQFQLIFLLFWCVFSLLLERLYEKKNFVSEFANDLWTFKLHLLVLSCLYIIFMFVHSVFEIASNFNFSNAISPPDHNKPVALTYFKNWMKNWTIFSNKKGGPCERNERDSHMPWLSHPATLFGTKWFPVDAFAVTQMPPTGTCCGVQCRNLEECPLCGSIGSHSTGPRMCNKEIFKWYWALVW